jgi:hypothetical protein
MGPGCCGLRAKYIKIWSGKKFIGFSQQFEYPGVDAFSLSDLPNGDYVDFALAI